MSNIAFETFAMRYDRQVIGYHACRRSVAHRLLDGDAFRPSSNDWDWLGSGVYFWEFGHQRAYDWARQWPRLQGKDFAVVGAILQLGNCLDLLDTDHTGRLAEFADEYAAEGGVLPENAGAKRLGDCHLINTFCDRMLRSGAPYDTVRGLFQEGDPVTAGSEIRRENHIQIVARRPTSIIGLFRPRGFTEWAPAVAPAPTQEHAVRDE